MNMLNFQLINLPHKLARCQLLTQLSLTFNAKMITNSMHDTDDFVLYGLRIPT